MPIAQLVMGGIPGANYVNDPSIVNVIPLEVCFDNKQFDVIQGSAPGNRQVRYYPGEGKLLFLDTFGGTITNDVGRTQVYIRYKY